MKFSEELVWCFVFFTTLVDMKISFKVLATEVSLWPSTFLLPWLPWSLWYLLCLAGIDCGATFSEAVKTLSCCSLLKRLGFHGSSLHCSLSTRWFPGSSSIRLGPPTARLGSDDTWRVFFFMNAPTLPFFLFMPLSFFNVPHVCGCKLPQGFFGNAAIMTSTCFHAQAVRRRPAAGSEAPSAGREQRGHANELRSNCQQFFSEPSPPVAPIVLHLQLPPADRSVWSRPSAGTAPPRRHQASFTLEGKRRRGFMSRRKLYNDQQAPHVDGEPLERLFRVAMGIAALFRELVLLARLTKKS